MRAHERHAADTVQEIPELLLAKELIVAREAGKEHIAAGAAQEAEKAVLRKIFISCRKIRDRLEYIVANGKLLPNFIQINRIVSVYEARVRITAAEVSLNPFECVFLFHNSAPLCYFPLIISMPTTMLSLISSFRYCLTSATSILSIFSIALSQPVALYSYSAFS